MKILNNNIWGAYWKMHFENKIKTLRIFENALGCIFENATAKFEIENVGNISNIIQFWAKLLHI